MDIAQTVPFDPETETLNTTPPVDSPDYNDPAYIEAMVKKSEEGTTGQKPLYAGKYQTEEDLTKGTLELLKKQYDGNLEKAYKALMKNGFGSQETEESDETNETDVDETDVDEVDPESPKSIQIMDEATMEWAENGELSEDTYKKLQENFKVDKELIDAFIEGEQAKAELAAHQVYSIVGGKEAFDSMKSWAANNLTQQQIMMFNEDIISGDMAKISRAVEMCNNAYRKANGHRGSNYLDSTRSGASSNSGGYASLAEWKRDIADPRYTSGDTAFQNHVMNRLKYTKTF